MKKVLVAVLAGLVSFGAGLFGFLYFMPTVAPERAREAQIFLDSIRVADSLAHLANQHVDGSAGEAATRPDSTMGLIDSLQIVADGAFTLAANDSSHRVQAVLADSLRAMMNRVNALTAENAMLRRQVQESAAPQWGGAAALSGTLTKLDDKELKAILQQLDTAVLEQLYLNSSSRNQTRLLQTMPADKAAAFVQNLMKGSASQAAGNTTTAAGTGSTLR